MNPSIPLGSIVQIRKGKRAPRVFEQRTNEAHPYLQIDEVRGVRPTRFAEDPKGVQVTPDDLCIVWDGANAGTVGYGVSGLIGSTVARMRLSYPSAWETRYLGRLLQSKFRELNDQAKARGATIPHINKQMLELILLPELDLGEQRRIARILDKTDALRRKLLECLLLADAFLNSTFLEFFGDPVSNPRGWPIASVDDLGAVQGGLQVSRKRDSLPMRRAYLRVANVFRDKLVLSEIKEIGLTEAEFSRTKLHSGDVLIVEGHGNPNEIGRTCVWDGSIKDCVHQNHLIRFRANKNSVSPVYFSRLLNSQGGRLQLIAAARTTSGLNTISTTKVKKLAIPLPPIEKQYEFESFVEHQEQMVMKVCRVREEATRLFSSLSQRAFEGEL